MLLNIKSNIILRNVFIYLEYKTKLDLIKFNKTLQQKIGLNIIDYRRLSGKYKIIKNNIVREYNSYNDKLLFEGLYSNGKRNGDGKEYNENGDIIFEGEYYNGKRWKGFEKVYDEDTEILVLECEYLNGKINGTAKEYDKFNGELLFEGEYLNGKRNGKGKEYKTIPKDEYSYFSSRNEPKTIVLFEGEYLNGERKKGKEYDYRWKLIYEGGYLHGKRHGKGKVYTMLDRVIPPLNSKNWLKKDGSENSL